jgi:photosystem II stability/assembly factor-like uncharacterized protein
MLRTKKFLIISFLLFVVFSLSGCVQAKKSSGTSTIDGGVFKTTNKGLTWQQKVAVPTISGKPLQFTGANVSAFVKDPSDDNAYYLGTKGNGLYYTYDGAKSWTFAANLGQKTVLAIAVDPNDKCNVYATIGNKVFKTTDCNRNWEQVYFDNDVKATINAIGIDPVNSKIVYVGISSGDVIKSLDGGASWQTIHRVKSPVLKIIIDSNNGQRLFIVSKSKGVFYTTDGGNSWNDLNKILKETELGTNVKDIIFIKGQPEKMFIATKSGILITEDNGGKWDKLDLLPPDQKAEINAIAVNQANTNEIYYVTNTTFYSSIDRGVSWKTVKLPTSRSAVELLISNTNPNELYMGVLSVEKK